MTSEIERMVQAKRSELDAAQKAQSSISKSMDAAQKANASLGTIMGIQQVIDSLSDSSSSGNSGSGNSSSGSSRPSGSSGGSSSTTVRQPTEAEKKMKAMYDAGQLGLMERTYFLDKIAPKFILEKESIVEPDDNPLPVNYGDYGKTVKQNDYDSLSDVDLIARLIFHEDGHIEGQNAIAWTMHNRMVNPTGSGIYNDYAALVQNGYTNFMGNDKDGLNKFWSTNEWISKNPKWYFGAAAGLDTQSSWEHSVDLAIALVKSGADTEKFEEFVSNPFENMFNPNIDVKDIKYYVNRPYKADSNQVKIGSNYFSNLPH